MPERHDILQENSTPRAQPAFASTELPTAESIFSWSGSLRAQACRPSPCLRAVLASLASVTAVALLVYFCSRVYEGRVLQDLGSRRLASTGDSNVSGEVCGLPSDDETKQQPDISHTANRPDANESQLPFKKRKYARAAEASAGGGERHAEQIEQQQKDQPQEHQTAPPSTSVSIAAQAASRPHQHVPSRFPAPSTQPPAPTELPAELDAAAELLSLVPHQHAIGYFATGTRAPMIVDAWQRQQELLWRERHRLPRHRHPEGKSPHGQKQQEHLQQQQHLHHVLYKQQQYLNWMHLGFQQQQQQQSLLQQQEPRQGPPTQEEPQAMQHGMLQVTRQDKGEERHRPAKRKRPAEPDLWREGHPRPLQPSDPPSGPSLEDEWIAPDSPRPEADTPITSEQALHVSAPAAVEDTSAVESVSTQAASGFSVRPVATSHAAEDAGASWGDAPEAVGARAQLASSIAVRLSAVQPPGAVMTTKERISLSMPALTSLLTHAGPERPVAQDVAGTGAATSATSLGSSVPASVSNAGMGEFPRRPGPSPSRHPFARLPMLAAGKVPGGLFLDFKRAAESGYGMRNPEPLLEKAHSLLSRELLYPAHVAELVQVTQMLMAHAMHHQCRDVSKQKLSRAVKQLGIRFLLLDAVVSALTILGQTRDDTYWKRLTDSINHAFPPLPTRQTPTGRPNTNFYRARDLSKAIQILKTGRRPDDSQLIRIKKMLFCWPSSPTYFQRRVFDGWRVDDGLTNNP